MAYSISNSTNVNDYEILIRKRGDSEYASYCPQLNLMLTGTFHEEVENLMYERIKLHIETLKTATTDHSNN
ncbi:MAG TPA: hypothetical protein PLE30_00355 [Candidatus Kapabacteria bacterium]|nr:hypothetical protein [Candidatus Kapabacteria bacterium]